MAEKVVKLPKGTAGIVLSSVQESQQEDLFFPCDTRLVAVNVNGDPECGTLVYDLNEDNELDRERGARLQSAFRVVKQPLGLDNAIAFQIGPSGQGDTGGGWFMDIPDGGDAQNLAIAQGSYQILGAFHPGHKDDKHNLGRDADGNPINPLHIPIFVNFYRDRDQDGPLGVDGFLPPGPDLNQRIPVHFGWDTETESWRWYTTSAWYTPTEPTQPVKPGTPTPGATGVPNPDPTRPPVPTGSSVPGTVAQGSLATGMALIASLSAVTAPALAVRPVNYNPGQTDPGLFAHPTDTVAPDPNDVSDDELANAQAQGAEEARQAKADNAPITGMGSGFGAQGGSADPSDSSSTSTGAEDDPWVYTSVPKGRTRQGKQASKYLGGTANGGIVYHPAETDLRDVRNYAMAPPNTTLSTMYILVGPNAYFGAGVPELSNGTLKDGYVWGINTATGDLDWYTHSSSAAKVKAMTFTKTSQNMRWFSGQSYYGEIDHANTGNQTYTFPDKTGTVALTSDVSGSTVYTATANASLNNSASETSMIGTGVGSQTLSANYLTAGKTIRISIAGFFTTGLTPQAITVKLKLGSSTIASATFAPVTSATNLGWKFDGLITCRSTGGTGTVIGQGEIILDSTTLTAALVDFTVATATTTIDTTATQKVDMTITTALADSGSTYTSTNATIEAIGG